MAYEQYHRTSAKVTKPVLSIGSCGRIGVNAAACRLLMEAGIKTVVILWDEAAKKMAIKEAPKGAKDSFTITFAPDSHSGSFTVKSFLRHIGWTAPTRVPLPTTWNTEDKMLEASLPARYVGGSTAAKGEEGEPRRRR